VFGCGSSDGGGTGGAGPNPCAGNPCDDRNDCTADVCNPSDGSCTNTTQPDDSFCDVGYCQTGECEPIASVFPCTEQGINDAIEVGGGPHGFECTGPKLIVTVDEIVIDNDVILDGRNLTVDGTLEHRLFSVLEGVTAELWRFTVKQGHWADAAGGGGGGIYNQGDLNVLNCTIKDSESVPVCVGGGICTNGTGGGILNDGTMTITNSTIAGNRAQGGGISSFGGGVGGGISNEGTLTLMNSTVFRNVGQVWGGGIANGRGPRLLGATLTVINTTVSDNLVTAFGSTVSRGAGVWNEGTATLISSTMSENLADGGNIGNSLASGRGTLTVSNSVVDGNCDGDIASAGYNIESPGNTCGFNEQTDLANVTSDDLDLEFLLDNGGPTRTHKLLPGSVAIDFIPEEACIDVAGEPLTTDQRGVERPRGPQCDAGAFELW
jgi:hypothetical protein